MGSMIGPSQAAPEQPPPERRSPRLPAGTRLRGVNLVGRFDEVTALDSDNVWASLWGGWDWDGLIAPQLDDISTIGNSVRIFGNTLVMALGNIDLNTYLARWQRILDRAQSLGLLIYPCGGDLGHWGDFTWQQSIETYSRLAELLAAYPGVIGVDIVNEAYATRDLRGRWAYHQPEPFGELLASLGAAVRVSGLPITFSRNIVDRIGWTTPFFTDELGDFLDFHVYYQPDASDPLDAYGQSWGAGKKLVIGEFGINTTVSSVDRTARYEAVRSMCENDPNCVGALSWSAYDLSPKPEWQFGLFDDQRNLRADLGEPFARFEVASSR